MSQKSTDKTQTRARGRPSSGTGPPAPSTEEPPTVQPTDGGSVAASSDTQEMLRRILARLDAQDQINTTRAEKDNEHRTEQANKLDHITGFMKESRTAWESCRERLLVVEHQLHTANEKNRKLESQLNNMENRLRMCNIRVEGRTETDQEDLIKVIVDLARDIGVNLSHKDIASATRLGKRVQQNQTRAGAGAGQRAARPRTILVTFHHIMPRNKFYYARTSLRNIEGCRGVYLNDDVTQITRRQREDYRAVAALAREDGAEIRIHDDGLLINGRKHLLTEPHTLPSKYSLAKARTVELNDEIYFSSEHSYLSNFYPAHIVEEGIVYGSSEHMYQAYKCKHANELELMSLVIAAPTALDAKRLADTVHDSPEWRKVRDTAMAKVIGRKFEQNSDLAGLLTATGDKPLNEATRNDHFGIGVTLQSREIKDKSYRGTNKLGQILMARRAELTNVSN